MEKWLPWIVVAGVALFIWRRMQGGQAALLGGSDVAGASGGGAAPVAMPSGGGMPPVSGPADMPATPSAGIASFFHGQTFSQYVTGGGGAPPVATASLPSIFSKPAQAGLVPIAGPTPAATPTPVVAGPTQVQLSALKDGPTARTAFLGVGSVRGSSISTPTVAGPTPTATVSRPGVSSGRGGFL